MHRRHKHKIASVYLVILFCGILFGELSLTSGPGELGGYLSAQVVGLKVGVDDNPYNTVAEQLKSKEAALQEKERLLRAQEENLLRTRVERQLNDQRNVIIYFALVALALFGLIIFSFYLERKRDVELLVRRS